MTLRYVRLLLHDLERPDQAEPVLLSLEQADPGNLEVGLDIAAMRWLQGDTAAAEAKYKRDARAATPTTCACSSTSAISTTPR